MDLKIAFARARRGVREDARLYIVAVSSLAVAFLCLGVALLAITNLAKMTEVWGQSGRMTVYLRDGARNEDISLLRDTLERLPEVRAVSMLTPADARQQFIAESHGATSLSAVPVDAFPASLEVELAANASSARLVEISSRISSFAPVEEVETYRTFFDRLHTLLTAGRSVAALLAFLVLICVFAVVGNTIRLAVAGRKEEIEVLKLCGATDGFVRGPFLVEGAMQGFAAALVALLLLFLGFALLRGQVDTTLSLLTGVRASFLHPLMALVLVAVGAVGGAMGSAISLRRYLAV